MKQFTHPYNNSIELTGEHSSGFPAIPAGQLIQALGVQNYESSMSKPENITVEITGMSCASCAQRIESAIGSTDGVSESIVNFATRKATVTGSIPAEEIHKIIEGLGYNVVKEETPAISEEEIAQSEWKKFLTSKKCAADQQHYVFLN